MKDKVDKETKRLASYLYCLYFKCDINTITNI